MSYTKTANGSDPNLHPRALRQAIRSLTVSIESLEDEVIRGTDGELIDRSITPLREIGIYFAIHLMADQRNACRAWLEDGKGKWRSKAVK